MIQYPDSTSFTGRSTNTTHQAPVIFETSIGMSKNLSLLLAGFNGIAYFLSTFPVVWILDRVGRRKVKHKCRHRCQNWQLTTSSSCSSPSSAKLPAWPSWREQSPMVPGARVLRQQSCCLVSFQPIIFLSMLWTQLT